MPSDLNPESTPVATTTFLHSGSKQTQPNPTQNAISALLMRFFPKSALRHISKQTKPITPLLITAASLCLPLSAAHAVIIAGTNGGDGSANTTQGAMPNGWNNVGSVLGASGVYLGNGWVITADHVGTVSNGTPINFGGAVGSFTADGQVVRLKTAGQDADLQMFHLSANPALPALNIPTSSPTLATSIYMAGFGRNRDADVTYYSVNTTDPNNYVWTQLPGPSGANAAGYQYATGNTKRWGTNITSTNPSITGSPTISTVNAGFGPTQVFFSNFSNDNTATPFEAELANGDSGGGVFDASNNLIGLINYKGTFGQQPADTAIYGNLSDMADLSAYRSQILSAMTVPEPTSITLLAAGGLLLIRRKRR